MPISEETIAAICVSVFSAGGFWEVVRRWLDRRKGETAREDVKQAVSETLANDPTIGDAIKRAVTETLADDPTISGMNDKLSRDFERLDEQDERIRDLHLAVLRHYLFIKPMDRKAHEAALEAGEQYLKFGGNGIGHVQVDRLRKDYERRLEHNDWKYTL